MDLIFLLTHDVSFENERNLNSPETKRKFLLFILNVTDIEIKL